MGVEEEVPFMNLSTGDRLYRGIPWSGPDWVSREWVMAGRGFWRIAITRHPECIDIRRPEEGEIFSAETGMLWVSRNKLILVTGDYATRLLAEQHGAIIDHLQTYLRERLFDDVLTRLDARCGLSLDGTCDEAIISAVMAAVAVIDVIAAGDDIVDETAAKVAAAAGQPRRT